MNKILVSKDKIEQLRRAYKNLQSTSILVYESARGQKPFKISKLLNVMGKVLDDYEYIIGLLIGEREMKSPTELKKLFKESFPSPPLSIWLAYLEEKELVENKEEE